MVYFIMSCPKCKFVQKYLDSLGSHLRIELLYTGKNLSDIFPNVKCITDL